MQTLKVVIPMAGRGTRLRPHTWSKPKQLVSVAGKTVLDHVLDTLSTLSDPEHIELVNIVGYLGEQIETHMREHHPQLKAHYVIQDDPRGQSHAVYLARQYLKGPMMVIFADTLIETDLSFLREETADAVVWVKPVPDPRRFGVAETDHNRMVTKLVEKPDDISNNLAVVGFYYFKNGEDLITAIEEQMQRDVRLKGEFYLADAVTIMLKRGLKMRSEQVDVWLDAGTIESLLETNHYLLDNGHSNHQEAANRENVVIIPPVFVHPKAQVMNSVIGPHVSMGVGCRVENSVIRDSILEDYAKVTDVILEKSLIGRYAQIQRRAGMINAGDQTTVTL